MSTTPNIPNKDSLFDDFQTDLVDAVTTNATAWGITTGELTSLTGAQTPWAAAWAIAKNKDNRTRAEIQAKKTARVNYLQVLRPFIQTRIQGNPLMTAADKLLCGIKPRDTVRTRVPVPTTTPLVSFLNEPGNSITMYFSQGPGEPGSSSRAKPRGVTGLMVAFAINPSNPVTGPESCPMREIITRSPKRFNFDPSSAGQTVYCFACWVNSRGEQGPWTGVQHFVIW